LAVDIKYKKYGQMETFLAFVFAFFVVLVLISVFYSSITSHRIITANWSISKYISCSFSLL